MTLGVYMSRAEPIHIGVKKYKPESLEGKRREREQFAYPIKVSQKELAIGLDGS